MPENLTIFGLEAITALYILFFLFTLAILGALHLIGRRRFGPGSDYFKALRISLANYLKVTSLLGTLSILLISSGKVPSTLVSYLCIPFFAINTSVFATFFRLLKHYKMTSGYKR